MGAFGVHCVFSSSLAMSKGTFLLRVCFVDHLDSSDNCLTEDMLPVECSCLVGQSGVFQWRRAFINGTQIDTIGFIAVSLSMVEAVSCTAVNLQVEKVVEF